MKGVIPCNTTPYRNWNPQHWKRHLLLKCHSGFSGLVWSNNMVLYQAMSMFRSRRKQISPGTQLVTNKDTDHLSSLISDYSKPSVPRLDLPGVIEAGFVNIIVYCPNQHILTTPVSFHTSPTFLLRLLMDPERAVGVVRSTSPNLARMMEGRLGCPFSNLIIPTLSDFTLPYISSSVRPPSDAHSMRHSSVPIQPCLLLGSRVSPLPGYDAPCTRPNWVVPHST